MLSSRKTTLCVILKREILCKLLFIPTGKIDRQTCSPMDANHHEQELERSPNFSSMIEEELKCIHLKMMARQFDFFLLTARVD